MDKIDKLALELADYYRMELNESHRFKRKGTFFPDYRVKCEWEYGMRVVNKLRELIRDKYENNKPPSSNG